VPQQRRRSHNHHDADLPRSHAWLTLTCMRDPKQYYRTAPAAKAGSDLQCQLVIESWRVVQTAFEQLIAQDLTFCMQISHNNQPQRDHVLISSDATHVTPADVQAPPASSAMAVTLGSDTLAPLGSLPGAAPQCISDSLDVYCIHTQVQTSCVS